MSRHSSVLVPFLLLSLIWGASFLFIEISLRGLSPPQIVLGRLVAGATVLQLLVLARGQRLPRSRRLWAHLAMLAAVANVLPFYLLAWSQQRITSGLAGVLNGSTPLFTLGIAILFLAEERLTRARAVGLGLGFVGVVIVVGPWDQNPLTSSIPGQLACLGAALSYGISFVFARRVVKSSGLGPLVLSAGQLGSAALIMLAMAPWVARGPVELTAPVVGSMLVLGAVGTGIAYPLSFRLIAAAGATSASLVTYVIPVVAVLLGVIVLDEPVGWNLFAGAAVVILGIAIAEERLGRRKPDDPVASRPTVDAPPLQDPI